MRQIGVEMAAARQMSPGMMDVGWPLATRELMRREICERVACKAFPRLGASQEDWNEEAV